MQALTARLEAGEMRAAQLTADLQQVRQQLVEATEAQQQHSQALTGAERSVADSESERSKLVEVSRTDIIQHCIAAISTASCAQPMPRKQIPHDSQEGRLVPALVAYGCLAELCSCSPPHSFADISSCFHAHGLQTMTHPRRQCSSGISELQRLQHQVADLQIQISLVQLKATTATAEQGQLREEEAEQASKALAVQGRRHVPVLSPVSISCSPQAVLPRTTH